MKYLPLMLMLIPLVMASSCMNVPSSFYSDVQIIVGSKAKMSDAILASRLSYLIARDNIKLIKHNITIRPVLRMNVYGKNFLITNNTTILPYNITISDLTCKPNILFYYTVEEPNVTDIVILDNQPLTAKHYIVIGSWWVNSYARWTKSVIKRPGDIICTVKGDYMYIAGWTADDTWRAAYNVLYQLKLRGQHELL